MTQPTANTRRPTDAEAALLPTFALRKSQSEIWFDDVTKIFVVMGGYASGKTALLAHLMMRAEPDIRHLLASNTYDQITEGIIPELMPHWEAANCVPVFGIEAPREWRENWKAWGIETPFRGVRSPNTLIFPTGQHFVVTGLDGISFRRRKGPQYGSLFCDEVCELSGPDALDLLLPRLRCGQGGRCLHRHGAYFFGNPPPPFQPHWIREYDKRMREVNDREVKDGRPPVYRLFEVPTRENVAAVGEGYESFVRASIPEGAEDALLGGRLLAFRSGATTYRSWSEANKIPVAYDPLRSVHVAFDFNHDPACATLGHELTDAEVPAEYRGKGLEHIGTFGEVYIKGGCDVYQLALHLVRGENVNAPPNFHGLARHGAMIILYGDPAGYQHRAEARDGATAWSGVLDILNSNCAHVHFDAPRTQVSEADSVFLMNTKMHSDGGQRSYWVDPRYCPMLIRDYEKVIPDKKGLHLIGKHDLALTHLSDAERYRVYQRCRSERGGKGYLPDDLRAMAGNFVAETVGRDNPPEIGYPDMMKYAEPKTLKRRGGKL